MGHLEAVTFDVEFLVEDLVGHLATDIFVLRGLLERLVEGRVVLCRIVSLFESAASKGKSIVGLFGELGHVLLDDQLRVEVELEGHGAISLDFGFS